MVEQFTGKTSCSIIQTGFYDVGSFRCVVGFSHSVPPLFFEKLKIGVSRIASVLRNRAGFGEGTPQQDSMGGQIER